MGLDRKTEVAIMEDYGVGKGVPYKVGNRRGMTVTELLLVASIVTSVPGAAYVKVKDKAIELDCQNRLRQIGLAITDFMLDNGSLPQAAFYPENPDTDAHSIKVVLKPHGADGKLFICPGAPQVLQQKGLTFLWNDRFSGKRQEAIPDGANQWLMVELNAIREIPLAELGKQKPSDELLAKLKQVPPAHRGGYDVLYVDGHVGWTDRLPRLELPKE